MVSGGGDFWYLLSQCVQGLEKVVSGGGVHVVENGMLRLGDKGEEYLNGPQSVVKEMAQSKGELFINRPRTDADKSAEEKDLQWAIENDIFSLEAILIKSMAHNKLGAQNPFSNQCRERNLSEMGLLLDTKDKEEIGVPSCDTTQAQTDASTMIATPPFMSTENLEDGGHEIFMEAGQEHLSNSARRQRTTAQRFEASDDVAAELFSQIDRDEGEQMWTKNLVDSSHEVESQDLRLEVERGVNKSSVKIGESSIEGVEAGSSRRVFRDLTLQEQRVNNPTMTMRQTQVLLYFPNVVLSSFESGEPLISIGVGDQARDTQKDPKREATGVLYDGGIELNENSGRKKQKMVSHRSPSC